MRPENCGVFAGFQLLLTTLNRPNLSPLFAISFAADGAVLCGCGVLKQAFDLDHPGSKNSKGDRKYGVGLRGKDPFQMLQDPLLVMLNVRCVVCVEQSLPEIPKLPVYAQKRCRPDAA